MSAQDLHKLVRDLENTDPRSQGQQEKLCERIRQFQTMMERAQARELAGYLDTAALLTDYLRVMGGIGPEEVRSIVVRLVRQVEEAFTPQTDPQGGGGDGDHDPVPGLLGAGHGGEPSLAGGPLSPSMGSPASLAPDGGLVGGKFLGEILLQLGYVRPEDIDRALLVQRATGIRMGEALVDIGATSYERIKTALSVQERLTKGVGTGHRSGRPGRTGGGGPPSPPRSLSL